ncbi:hypothetical protein HDV00_004237 [Rhizophlyctis rosea]|nr:hypothetical protein HDV00_004237 [Rhizophlyctis rosea]
MTTGASSPVSDKIKVTAGDQLSGDDPVIAVSHKGPIRFYLNKVSNSSAAAPTSGWFTIYEDGLNAGTWAVDKLIANDGVVSFTLPSGIAPGDYLLRSELIALHIAKDVGGVHVYTNIAQLTISSSGSSTFPGVSFPGAYSPTDSGIWVPNIYNSAGKPYPSSYSIPGPRPISCSGASNGGGSSNPATTQQQQQPTTTTRAVTTTTAATTTTIIPARLGQGMVATELREV